MTVVMSYKRCSGCGKNKRLEEFSRNRDSADGHQSNCKHCDTIIGRSNRWRRERGVTEVMARKVLEEVQKETCPLCWHTLHWTDVGMQLIQDAETREQLAFVHQKCVVDQIAETTALDALKADPPFRRANGGKPFITPEQPHQESLL